MRRLRTLLLAALLLGASGPVLRAQVVAPDKAQAVAENWLRFIVERDGQWAGSASPSLSAWSEWRDGGSLLGYFAAVDPHGYIVVSALTDFPPITAYSTTSDLDPTSEVGMSAMLKDALANRTRFLIEHYGGIDAAGLKDIKLRTPEANRQAWSVLLDGPRDLVGQLGAIDRDRSVVGPLLESRWNQVPPYNGHCPNLGCNWPQYGSYDQNALVGCVPLAMAQVMRFFCWPPYSPWRFYDWAPMLPHYVWDSNGNRFVDDNGVPCTYAQLDRVAWLCNEAGAALQPDIDYGCGSTGAFVCSFWNDDARDAFEEHFNYSSSGGPDCEDRTEHDQNGWWQIIVGQINANQPMVYHIVGGSIDHAIVIDGYDSTGGQHHVHANYGWDDGHTNWYALDNFDCDPGAGFLRCDYNQEEMIRDIYPRTRLCGSFGGSTIPPHDSPYDLHRYVTCDVLVGNTLTVQGGAWIQFLPGTALQGDYAQTRILGRSPDATRLFSISPPFTRGVVLYDGGSIAMYPPAGLRFH